MAIVVFDIKRCYNVICSEPCRGDFVNGSELLQEFIGFILNSLLTIECSMEEAKWIILWIN